MQAMILAAGRGARLKPLTNTLPKALIEVQGKPLIEHQIRSLVASGIKDIVINVCHLGHMIQNFLGDGTRFHCNIRYSVEDELLDTGGGIFRALPLLGKDAFLVLNGDILTNFFLKELSLPPGKLAHLVLVDKPTHYLKGDFSLQNNLITQGEQYTFGGIALYHPDLFADCKSGIFSIVPLIHQGMATGHVTGEYYPGKWWDIGTPDSLLALQN